MPYRVSIFYYGLILYVTISKTQHIEFIHRMGSLQMQTYLELYSYLLLAMHRARMGYDCTMGRCIILT